MDTFLPDDKLDELVKTQLKTILNVLIFERFYPFDIISLCEQILKKQRFIIAQEDCGVRVFELVSSSSIVPMSTDFSQMMNDFIDSYDVRYFDVINASPEINQYVLSMFSDPTVKGFDDIRGRCMLYNSRSIVESFNDLFVILSYCNDIELDPMKFAGVTKRWYDEYKFNIAIALSSVANLISEQMTIYGGEYILKHITSWYENRNGNRGVVTFKMKGYNINECKDIKIHVIRPE